MRFGVDLFPFPGFEEALGFGEQVERLGFDGVWAPDHMIFTRKEFLSPEIWEVLLAIGLRTSRIVVGTVVSDPHRYHPAFFAQRVATISQLVGEGRVILGLGVGESMNLDPYGILWDMPADRTMEAIRVIRGLWQAASDSPFSFEGEFFRLRNAYLQVKSKGTVPIYIGANSLRTRRFTGELGDGWLPSGIPSDMYRRWLSEVRAEAGRLGRSVEAGMLIFASLDEDGDRALQALKPMRYAMIWPAMLRELGYEVPEEFERYAAFHRIMPSEPECMAKVREYNEFVPERLIPEFSLCGNRRDFEEGIENYIRAGVEHIIFLNVSPERMRALEELSRIVQQYK